MRYLCCYQGVAHEPDRVEIKTGDALTPSTPNLDSLCESQCDPALVGFPELSPGILDEPESALDYAMRYRMLHLLRQSIDRTQGCALIALHDPTLALNCCDRLLFLDGGTIAGAVSPDVDAPEETERLLQKIYGSVQLLRAGSRGGTAQWVMLRDSGDETKPLSL